MNKGSWCRDAAWLVRAVIVAAFMWGFLNLQGCALTITGTVEGQPDVVIPDAAVPEVAVPVEDVASMEVVAVDAPTMADAGVEVSADSTDAVPPNVTLRVNLGAGVQSRTVVRNATVDAVQVAFTNGPEARARLRGATFVGQANLGRGWQREDFRRLVIACRVMEGATQLGSAVTPDSRGRLEFRDLNVLLERGVTRALTVRCTISTVVPEAGARFSIGIDDGLALWVENLEGGGWGGMLGASLVRQLSNDPSVVISVMPRGSLAIVHGSMRQPTILVAGTDVWHNLAEYRFTATFEEQTVDLIRVRSSGDAASFSAVAVASDGVVLGWNILPSGRNREADVRLKRPLELRPLEARTVQVWARLANTVSRSSAPGDSSVARSGALVAAGLAHGHQAGEWDSTFASDWNVRAQGRVSGDRIHAADADPRLGHEFVVRRSRPVVTALPLERTTIVRDSERELYRWQISADAAGSISWRKETFHIENNRVPGSTLTFDGFQLYRGGVALVSASACEIVDQDGRNLRTSLASSLPVRFDVVVRFTDDEIVSGSGNVYSLRATPRGRLVSGDSVWVRPLGRELAIVTGRLTRADLTNFPGPHINQTMGGFSPVAAVMAWSDLSEVPHNDDSFDWTNGTFIEDRTVGRTLSVP